MSGVKTQAFEDELMMAFKAMDIKAGLIDPPTQGKPYITIDPGMIGPDETAFNLDDYRTARYTFHYVGSLPDQVRWLQGKVHDEFLRNGRWDAVPGVCGMLIAATDPLIREDQATWRLSETFDVHLEGAA